MLSVSANFRRAQALSIMLVRPALLSLASTSRTAYTRNLFTLPDLSSFSPFHEPEKGSDEPQEYHERQILPYRPSELYKVVSDVGSYPHFVPFCTDARILNTSSLPSSGSNSPSSHVMDAELTVGFLTFRESYTSVVTCRPNECVEAVASSSTPLFKSLTTTWRFQPASPRSPHPTKSGLHLAQPHSRFSSTATSTHSESDVTIPVKDPDSSPTLVTLDLSFAFASPVHAAVSATFFGQVSKMMVKAFEERCLDVYGPGRR
ncbi:dehydrase and lipid transport-domain-containing protein [Abortiporus biennis]|nr:dehydrase and lipid transport-domain-containing protein [Abortiporus biennis]